MSKWKTIKRTLGIAGMLGVLTLAMLPTQADARGRVYAARNGMGAIEKYLTIYETNGPANIVVLEYEPVGEGNGAPYIIHATGHFNSNSLVILHADKQGESRYSQDLPYVTYPSREGEDSFTISSNGRFPLADKLLNNCVPGTYQYYDDGILMPSEYAMRMLVGLVPYNWSGIDGSVATNDPFYYTYEYDFHSNLHEAYPALADTNFGRTVHVYVGPDKRHLNSFIVDGKMENIWRVNNDDTLFQVYGLDGLG